MTAGGAWRLPADWLVSENGHAADASLFDADDHWGTGQDSIPWPQPVADSPPPLLGLRGATAVLPGGRRFGPFTLDVQAGERVAILGPSGAGKSTLLKLMAAELAPREGEASLEGRPMARWGMAGLARRRAVLPQSHTVAFGLPVELVVGLGRVARRPDPLQARSVAEALALAQAGHLAARRFDTLSGGEQARVQLARVFAQLWDERDGLVLVDEPLGALDPGLQFGLMEAMQSFAQARGHALVAVLHDINQALGHFDRLWLVGEGQLQGDLKPGADAVPALEQLYGIDLHCVPDAGFGLAVLPSRRRPQPSRHAACPLAPPTGTPDAP